MIEVCLLILETLLALWLVLGVMLSLVYSYLEWFINKSTPNIEDILTLLLWPLMYVSKEHQDRIDKLITKFKKK